MNKNISVKKNILMVGTEFWDSKMWFRRHHFAQRFANSGWKVLYVERYITLLKPFKKINHIHPFKLLAFFRDSKITENLKVISLPPGIPFEYKCHQIPTLNKKFFGLYIEYKAKQFFRNEPYVLICYNPFDVYLGLKNSCCTIYECYDEHGSYPGNEHIKNEIYEAEHLLIKKADIVSVTASSLKKKKAKLRDDLVVIPNGVDLSQFENPNFTNIPKDIRCIKHPIIMYVGAIYKWFNLTLVKQICAIHPEWNIVLIGPESILKNQVLPKNLYYLGVKDRKDIPVYLKVATLGIIPFIENELTLNVNPLKLYEYFAAGLSCVSSFMYEIKKYEEPYVLEIARNNIDFIKAIERNIGKKEYKLDTKISIAKARSWDDIFIMFQNLILSKVSKNSVLSYQPF